MENVLNTAECKYTTSEIPGTRSQAPCPPFYISTKDTIDLKTYIPHVAIHLVTQYLMKSSHMETSVGYVLMLYELKVPPEC